MHILYSDQRVFRGVLPTQNSKRFTLIELLVCIAVIAMLAALLLPALGKVRYRVKITQCLHNQKQVALGIEMYTSDFDSYYPYPDCPAGDNCAAGDNTHARLNGKFVRQSVRGLGHGRETTDHPGHWNNMREDVEMTYFGGFGAARSLFMCPIVEPEYSLARVRSYKDSSGNVQKQFPFRPTHSNTIRWVPFATYFNNNPGRVTVSKAMRKVGDTWAFGTGSRVLSNSRGKECDVLVSDFMGRKSDSTSATMQISNHYEWGSGAFTPAGPINNWNTTGFGYDHLVPTNGTFIRSDGSGENVKGLHQAYQPDTTGGSVNKYRGVIVPLSYLE